MTGHAAFRAALMVGALAANGAASTTLNSMRWSRRVLLVSSPRPDDARAVLQHQLFTAWGREAAARDVTLVEVSDARVVGTSDSAAALRGRYGLEPSAFRVLLLGKDGHVALRAARPVDSATLEGVIDAMPMRRAGER